jgi:membrane-associated phospholipid phosphatase
MSTECDKPSGAAEPTSEEPSEKASATSDSEAAPPVKPVTVGDALAHQVEVRRGPASRWADALHEFGALDRAVYEAVARTPTGSLDGPMRRLSEAANYSRLWLGLAGAIALVGGKRGRRAALEGVVSIAVTSATVNLGIKKVHRRRRPERGEIPFPERDVPMPKSTSFPSGHAASAFAFAYSIGRHLPMLAVPMRVLALGVAYSRVHIGVHYPGDVSVGSVIGAGTGAIVAGVFDRLPTARPSSAILRP